MQHLSQLQDHHHVFPYVAGPTFHVPVGQGSPRAHPQGVRLQRQSCRCSENGNRAHGDHYQFDHRVFGRSWKSGIWKKTGPHPLLARTYNLFFPLTRARGLVRPRPSTRFDRHSSVDAEYTVLRILSRRHVWQPVDQPQR
jgi:hypothetical protein